jgi:hypothetical protein
MAKRRAARRCGHRGRAHLAPASVNQRFRWCDTPEPRQQRAKRRVLRCKHGGVVTVTARRSRPSWPTSTARCNGSVRRQRSTGACLTKSCRPAIGRRAARRGRGAVVFGRSSPSGRRQTASHWSRVEGFAPTPPSCARLHIFGAVPLARVRIARHLRVQRCSSSAACTRPRRPQAVHRPRCPLSLDDDGKYWHCVELRRLPADFVRSQRRPDEIAAHVARFG